MYAYICRCSVVQQSLWWCWWRWNRTQKNIERKLGKKNRLDERDDKWCCAVRAKVPHSEKKLWIELEYWKSRVNKWWNFQKRKMNWIRWLKTNQTISMWLFIFNIYTYFEHIIYFFFVLDSNTTTGILYSCKNKMSLLLLSRKQNGIRVAFATLFESNIREHAMNSNLIQN